MRIITALEQVAIWHEAAPIFGPKNPWMHRIVHYTSDNPPPQFQTEVNNEYDWGGGKDFEKKHPYTNFQFGPNEEPLHKNQGMYQINHPKAPLNNPPIGYLRYTRHPHQVHVDLLETHPDYQHHGVAAAMMQALAQDNPGYAIDPGYTTSQGTGFTNWMEHHIPEGETKNVHVLPRENEDEDLYEEDEGPIAPLRPGLSPEHPLGPDSEVAQRATEHRNRLRQLIDVHAPLDLATAPPEDVVTRINSLLANSLPHHAYWVWRNSGIPLEAIRGGGRELQPWLRAS